MLRLAIPAAGLWCRSCRQGSHLSRHARERVPLRAHLQAVEPTEGCLKHGIAISNELGFQTVEDALSERGSGELDEQVREGVQYHRPRARLSGDLSDSGCGARHDGRWLGLVRLLARREDD